MALFRCLVTGIVGAPELVEAASTGDVRLVFDIRKIRGNLRL